MQVIQLKSNHRYPTKRVFESRNTHSVSYGINSLAHLGPKIWDIVPEHFKEIVCLDQFKKEIEKWSPTNCPCKPCLQYIKGLGYIN